MHPGWMQIKDANRVTYVRANTVNFVISWPDGATEIFVGTQSLLIEMTAEDFINMTDAALEAGTEYDKANTAGLAPASLPLAAPSTI